MDSLRHRKKFLRSFFEFVKEPIWKSGEHMKCLPSGVTHSSWLGLHSPMLRAAQFEHTHLCPETLSHNDVGTVSGPPHLHTFVAIGHHFPKTYRVVRLLKTRLWERKGRSKFGSLGLPISSVLIWKSENKCRAFIGSHWDQDTGKAGPPNIWSVGDNRFTRNSQVAKWLHIIVKISHIVFLGLSRTKCRSSLRREPPLPNTLAKIWVEGVTGGRVREIDVLAGGTQID